MECASSKWTMEYKWTAVYRNRHQWNCFGRYQSIYYLQLLLRQQYNLPHHSTESYKGGCPVDLAALFYPQVLKVDRNSITGTLPAFIGNFSALLILLGYGYLDDR